MIKEIEIVEVIVSDIYNTSLYPGPGFYLVNSVTFVIITSNGALWDTGAFSEIPFKLVAPSVGTKPEKEQTHTVREVFALELAKVLTKNR